MLLWEKNKREVIWSIVHEAECRRNFLIDMGNNNLDALKLFYREQKIQDLIKSKLNPTRYQKYKTKGIFSESTSYDEIIDDLAFRSNGAKEKLQTDVLRTQYNVYRSNPKGVVPIYLTINESQYSLDKLLRYNSTSDVHAPISSGNALMLLEANDIRFKLRRDPTSDGTSVSLFLNFICLLCGRGFL